MACHMSFALEGQSDNMPPHRSRDRSDTGNHETETDKDNRNVPSFLLACNVIFFISMSQKLSSDFDISVL